MNRRSFFSNISAAVLGCYLGVGINLKKLVVKEPEDYLLIHQFESKVFVNIPSLQDAPWLRLMNKTKWEPGMSSVMRGVKMAPQPDLKKVLGLP